MPRVLSTVLLLVLLGATTVAFAVTEGLKLQPSPIRSVSVDKVFSPTCDCNTDQAWIRFRIRKTDTLTLALVDAHGAVVRTLVGPSSTKRGLVIATWDGRDEGAQAVSDGQPTWMARSRTASSESQPAPALMAAVSVSMAAVSAVRVTVAGDDPTGQRSTEILQAVRSVTGVDVLGGAKGTTTASDETFVDVIHPAITVEKTGRCVIVHDKHGLAGWHDVALLGVNDLLHCPPILAHRPKVFILSLRARSFGNRAPLRNIDHLLESRLGSSMPSRSAFETSSASECTCIFSITWWR